MDRNEIKDFIVEYEADGEYVPLITEKDNYSRFRRFDLPKNISAQKLRITLQSSNGDEFARMYGVRVYKK